MDKTNERSIKNTQEINLRPSGTPIKPIISESKTKTNLGKQC